MHKALLDSVGEYKDGTIMYYLSDLVSLAMQLAIEGDVVKILPREDLAFNIGKPYSSLQHTVGLSH